MVIEIVESIPNKDIIDKMGKGTNVNGVSTIKLNILKRVLVQTWSSPNNAYKESLNKTINDTPAPNKSIEKSTDMTNLAMEPYAAYPKSAYVIIVSSVSIAFESKHAVQ
ncbi:Uncharacterised protein [Chlamydia trachomatis]|nr:Uncharacterised protein [Chlamydia trachomatis]